MCLSRFSMSKDPRSFQSTPVSVQVSRSLNWILYRALSASPGGSNMLVTAHEPKNNFERNRLPERCLLSGILGVGWPFPFHTTQSERCVVEFRDRLGCVLQECIMPGWSPIRTEPHFLG
jgi:hypothetical protein